MTALYLLNQIQFAYSKKPVLNIEQLEITANSVTALLGSNGAGKSTLLKIMAFIEHPHQGDIRFCGKNPANTSLLSLRRRIVLVTQNPYLLRGTVFENVLLGLQFRGTSKNTAKKQTIKALEQVGMSAFTDRNIRELSGGEVQKVALARALTLEPKVLLLDEPFSHLDQLSIEHLSQLITDFSKKNGNSVIFSTHDKLHADTIADDFIYLVNGVPTSKAYLTQITQK